MKINPRRRNKNIMIDVRVLSVPVDRRKSTKSVVALKKDKK